MLDFTVLHFSQREKKVISVTFRNAVQEVQTAYPSYIFPHCGANRFCHYKSYGHSALTFNSISGPITTHVATREIASSFIY